MEYILREVKNNPEYIRFFKYSKIPDEAFFQTILGNSKFRESTHPAVTYADWSTNPGPARITGRHLDAFRGKIQFDTPCGSSTPLFARKFDETNRELLPEIRKTLRKTLPPAPPVRGSG